MMAIHIKRTITHFFQQSHAYRKCTIKPTLNLLKLPVYGQTNCWFLTDFGPSATTETHLKWELYLFESTIIMTVFLWNPSSPRFFD